jgi:hypothetical protein
MASTMHSLARHELDGRRAGGPTGAANHEVASKRQAAVSNPLYAIVWFPLTSICKTSNV